MASQPAVTLQRFTSSDIHDRQLTEPVDEPTLAAAQKIIATVKEGGEQALRKLSHQFGDIPSVDTPILLSRNDLKQSFDSLPVDQQQLLERTAKRVYEFATAQRQSVRDMTVPVLGGEAGHTVVPVQTAGCYAPGGRFPLPSSVLMTACTARAAGVTNVIVASPRPVPVTKAAAYVSGAQYLLCIGGAQAIAALTYGVGTGGMVADVICGPGNKYVTAAKKIVSGLVGIDMLAGPSELLVIADHTSNATTVAADLLAQSEHDTEARPILVTTDEALVGKVEAELARQLSTFPAANKHTATEACKKGFAVVCRTIDEAIAVSNRVAPEHLEVLCSNANEVGKTLAATGTYGGLFIGSHSAEVLGDYGCGPNHTLPTMATARYTGGLSVFNFLRIRTWLRIDSLEQSQVLVNDSTQLARLEGLEGHARSAERRLLSNNPPQANGVHKSERANGITQHEDAHYSKQQNGSAQPHANSNGTNGSASQQNGIAQPHAVSNGASGLTNQASQQNGHAQPTSSSPSADKALQHIRPDFQQLMEYSPVKPLDVLAAEIGMPQEELSKLNANENLYGPLPEVREAVAKSVMHIYPDPDQNALRQALANVHSDVPNVGVENIVCGAGSDELLDLLFTLTDAEAIVTTPPTFSMYQFFAQLHKSKVVSVARGDASQHWKLDLQAIVKATQPTQKGGQNASLVFIASPNNPTGDCISNTDVEYLCQHANALIVLDEAYADFASTSGIELVNKYSNLIVLRTFSKWAGLAGLRIGYMIAHSQLCVRIMQIKQPYNINVAADQAAIVSLQNRQRIVDGPVQAMIRERSRLTAALKKLQWIRPLPSEANFVLCELTTDALQKLNGTPRTLQKVLFNAGVLVRCYAGNSDSSLNNQIRISCGRPRDTDRLMHVLYEIEEKYQLKPTMNGHSAHQVSPDKLLVQQYVKHPPAAILFDMDGVLADVGGSYREAILQTAAAFGVTVTHNDITNLKNQGNANNDWDVTQRIIQKHSNGKINPSYEDVKAKFQQLYLGTNGKGGLRDNEKLVVNKGLLTELQRVTKLAVVTGRPLDDCNYFLDLHQIKAHFTALSTMDDGPMKPDASPTLIALERLNIINRNGSSYALNETTRSKVVYLIGDTIDDINSANAANQVLQQNNIDLVVLPLGIPPPHDTSIQTVDALYGAGAARVLLTLEEFRELALQQTWDIYASKTSSPATATPQPHTPSLSTTPSSHRAATHERITSETTCTAIVDLDGNGKSQISTGLGFLDHMLTALSKHSRIDMNLVCKGDLWIDDHHTTEDTGITLGTAIAKALGDKRGIRRYGYAFAPLDESLARAVVDFSGRSSQFIDLQLKRDNVGDVSSEMLEHFLRSFADAAKLTMHIETIRGQNDHHRAESSFKALALALRQAVSIDTANAADLPSTKGAL